MFADDVDEQGISVSSEPDTNTLAGAAFINTAPL